MSTASKLIKTKLGLLNLAEQFGITLVVNYAYENIETGGVVFSNDVTLTKTDIELRFSDE